MDLQATPANALATGVDCAHGIPLNLVCGASASEKDPSGADPHQPGAKLDAGKAEIMRGFLAYFPRATEAVAQVSMFGARKYTRGGWRTVPEGYERYSDALLRHLVKEQVEGRADADSGLDHAAHAAWNAMARLELLLADAT